jgi:adenylylsulfate kinase-like enzyme
MSSIKVTVTGLPGSGKTTLAQVIEDALRAYGFLVTNTDYDRVNERMPRPTDYVGKCAENLAARGYTVEIETVQAKS